MEQFLWTEKYRPKTVSECILPKTMKDTFQSIVDSGIVPNLILSGRPGMGKTTVAIAMAEELGRDCMPLNASEQGNIDMLRTTVRQFASSMSFGGKPKMVIFDEADYLNIVSTQPALRGFIEEMAINCSFVFTCNHKDRILDAIHSRCSIVEFVFPKEERAALAKDFYARCQEILDAENVEYEAKTVSKVILKFFPDFRRALNALQGMVVNGKLLTLDAVNLDLDAHISQLIPSLKKKEMASIRKWVATHANDDIRMYYRRIYDSSYEALSPASIADAILILSKYQFQSAFSVDQEINMMACLIELAATCEFA